MNESKLDANNNQLVIGFAMNRHHFRVVVARIEIRVDKDIPESFC